MRFLVVSLGAVALLSACGTSAPSLQSHGPVATLTALAAAFSACDIHKTMTMYAQDVEFAAPDLPQAIQGKANLERHLKGACSGAFTPVMKVIEHRSTTLAPGAVLVTGTYTIGRSDRPNERPWSSYFVATLSNQSGQWLVQSQASLPTSPTR